MTSSFHHSGVFKLSMSSQHVTMNIRQSMRLFMSMQGIQTMLVGMLNHIQQYFCESCLQVQSMSFVLFLNRDPAEERGSEAGYASARSSQRQAVVNISDALLNNISSSSFTKALSALGDQDRNMSTAAGERIASVLELHHHQYGKLGWSVVALYIWSTYLIGLTIIIGLLVCYAVLYGWHTRHACFYVANMR